MNDFILRGSRKTKRSRRNNRKLNQFQFTKKAQTQKWRTTSKFNPSSFKKGAKTTSNRFYKPDQRL